MLCGVYTDPDSGLGEVGPGGDLLAGRHVRVPVALERGLELLQLLAGEVRPLSTLSLALLVRQPATAAAATTAAISVLRRRPTFNDTVLIYRVSPKKVSPLTFCNNNRKPAPIKIKFYTQDEDDICYKHYYIKR